MNKEVAGRIVYRQERGIYASAGSNLCETLWMEQPTNYAVETLILSSSNRQRTNASNQSLGAALLMETIPSS